MADIYVDSNATGGGDTGVDWANAYLTVAQAYSAVSSYDVIHVASNHVDYFVVSTFVSAPDGRTGVVLISENSTTSAYEPGALLTSTADLTMMTGRRAEVAWYGFTFHAEGAFLNVASRVLSTARYIDCNLELAASNCVYSISGEDGSHVEIYGGTINFIASSNTISVGNASTLKFLGVEFTGISATTMFNSLGNGGMTIAVNNSKLNDPTNIFTVLSSGHDSLVATIQDSDIGAANIFSVANTYPNFDVEIMSSRGSPFSYEHMTFEGNVLEDKSTFLTSNYDGSTGFSILLEGIAGTGKGNVLRHKLLETHDLDLTADKTFTVNFTSASALSDTEFWIEIERPDITDQALSVIQSSRNADILSAGTDYVDNAEVWTAGAALTFDTSLTVTGAAGVTNANVNVYIYSAIPLVDIWADAAVVIS